MIVDAPEEEASTPTRRFTLGPESGPRLWSSRRGVLVGGLAAVVAAGGATVALLGLDDDAGDRPSARPSASVTEPAPSATRPPSVEVVDAPETSADETGRRTPVDSDQEEDDGDGGSSSPSVPLVGVLGALLAAGALEAWRRYRARPPMEPPLEPIARPGPSADTADTAANTDDAANTDAADADADADANTHASADADADAVANTHASADADADANTHASADADADAVANTHASADADADAVANTHASVDADAAGNDESPPEHTDATPAGRLDAALVHLARNVRPRSGQPCPQPRVVLVRDGRIDVMLSEPDPSPPSPWRPGASGRFWVIGPHTALPATDEAFPVLALVTVGTGESRVLVDLEAYGVVALVGDEDACRNVARAMLTELSTRAEGVVTVEVVGDLLDDATAGLNGVESHDSWDDVDTRVIGTSARLLDTGGWPHTWAARASGRIYDGWAPTVWFTEASPESGYREALEAIASRPGAGTAMVVVGDDPGCGLRIHLDDQGGFEIPDLKVSGKARVPAVEVAGSAAG